MCNNQGIDYGALIPNMAGESSKFSTYSPNETVQNLSVVWKNIPPMLSHLCQSTGEFFNWHFAVDERVIPMALDKTVVAAVC